MKLRLFPLLLFAATSLLTLKAFDMVFSGEALLSGPPSAYASGHGAAAEEKKPDEKKSEGKEEKKEGSILTPVTERPVEKITVPKGEESSKAAIESRIDDKRRETEERGKELDLRENLLKTAEKKLDDKTAALKQDEDKDAKDAESGGDGLKIKNLVIMYETMKTKSAAAIFNSLDMDVMIEVVSRMKPQVTAQIMAVMEPAAAQKLTVEMARRSLEPLAAKAAKNQPRAKAKNANPAKELPRIDTPPPAQN